MNEKMQKLQLTPYGAIPSQRQMRHMRDFSKKAFFHFGVNTFTNSEWGEGDELESFFNPTETDVRQWIRSIKAAGFTLAILTAKHHDGFCLWPSAYTEHTVKNSPYKNGQGDIVREFTDACREFGLACGLYLSPWDRHSPYWGSKEYSKHYNAQLTELLTNYGRIDEVWWDGAGSTETPYDWGLWAHTVRNLQPHAVIFGSLGATNYVECRWVGNESGYAGDPHYSTVDAAVLEVEDTALLNAGQFGGNRFIPAEVDVSIRPGWFYHADQDDQVKTVKELVDIHFTSIGRSSMLLLNFPPDRRGLLYDTDVKNAIGAHKIVSETFAFNLAAGATATADSVRDISCEPNFLFADYDDSFYAAADENITPTIEVTLPEVTTFDAFAIGEKIELGLRVKGYRVEAWVDGAWKVLADKRSIGYLWAEHFDAVTTDRVRIVIYDAACAPVLRTFGLYKLPQEYYSDKAAGKDREKKIVDLAYGPSAKILPEGLGVKVVFGGIYPFNTVRFNGAGISAYRLYAFDGTDYYLVEEGKDPAEEMTIRLRESIRSSYQIKLETGLADNSTLDIHVFEE